MSESLFDLSEDELLKLQDQYPYSALIPLAINRKKLQVSGSIPVNYLVELIGKNNNPGLALSSAFEKTDQSLRLDGLEDIEITGDIANIAEHMKNEDAKGLKYSLNEGIASEKLAEIYRQQGLYKEADEISNRISLKNNNK
jgi:hypothetical protein